MSLLLDIASWLCLLAGGFFCITGGLGLLRLPDFYTRSHGGGVLDSLGAGLTLLGLALQATDYLVVVKLGMIYLFLLITGPTAIHALARAALLAGLKPKLAENHVEAAPAAPAAPPIAETASTGGEVPSRS